jgi:Transposase DDE domain group 1
MEAEQDASCRIMFLVCPLSVNPAPVLWRDPDMDSSESPTYGAQEGSAYNGHFGCTCYHPLFVFNQLGAIWSGALCGRATSTAPPAGGTC